MELLAPKYKNKIYEHKVDKSTTMIETPKHQFAIREGSPEIARYQSQRPLALMESVDSLDILKRRTLFEAATTSEFPSQLREDFRVIMLSAYQAVSDVLYPICFNVSSTKETETYAGINKLKKTPGTIYETSPYFVLGTTAKADVTIRNAKHGGIVEITEEMIRYDKSGEIARLATELGESVVYERYQLITDQLTTAGNTTAQSTAVTLTPTNLEDMIRVYQTQTDSVSSKITAQSPDTLVVPAALQWSARRILESAGIPGSANNDINVLRGIVNLVVCPLLDANSTTRFYIGRSNNANGLIYQNVIGPTPETFTQSARTNQLSDDIFFYDLIRYKARLVYGIGVIDNTIWHRSTT
jgi:phage major head subunit gpT-like protein